MARLAVELDEKDVKWLIDKLEATLEKARKLKTLPFLQRVIIARILKALHGAKEA